MAGGKREGSGRKPIPRTRIAIHNDILEKLDKIEGKTYNDKIENILREAD